MYRSIIPDDGFSKGIHICHIFTDDEERNRALASFFASGLRRGERVLCIVDTGKPHGIIAGLKEKGVDLEKYEKAYLEVENDAAYYAGGRFSADDVLHKIGGVFKSSLEEGFKGLRVSGDMSWILRNGVDVDEVLEYEAKVLDAIKIYPCSAICEYDARKFDGSTIMGVLNVHPAVLLDGLVLKNPFYIEPKHRIPSGTT